MPRFFTLKVPLFIFLSVALSRSVSAQIYTPPPATGSTTSSSSPASTMPGYATPANGYGSGKTIAYAIAPFGVLAATYFIGDHHQVEIHPNLGFVWPGQVNFADTVAHLRDEGVYGVKTDVSLNDRVQVEGNFAYMNHVESRLVPTTLDQSFGIQPRTIFGLLYDLNLVFNFSAKQIPGTRISPYVTGGVGGLSTEVRNADSAVIAGQFYRTVPVVGAVILAPTRTVVVHDNSAFLSVNYGGGFKATKLWGPVGFRADIRGRTFPNFRGQLMTWPEATAGLTFTFGEP
jgi:hypothetical protein